MRPAALPAGFVGWWFAPWESPGAPQPPGGLLGRRDAYRRWCVDAGIAPALPAHRDPRWSALVHLDEAQLALAARLCGGLFAVRTLQPQALAGLHEDERRWCAGVANLQPLPRAPWRGATAHEAGLAACGLAWLALCLEQGFPGLWPRLRLRLAAPERAAVERCLHDAASAPSDAALARLTRCWRLCIRRAGGTGTLEYPDYPDYPEEET